METHSSPVGPPPLADRRPTSAKLSVTAARKILKAMRPHSADCRRYRIGMWDRSGNCERCSAFAALIDHSLPTIPTHHNEIRGR